MNIIISVQKRILTCYEDNYTISYFLCNSDIAVTEVYLFLKQVLHSCATFARLLLSSSPDPDLRGQGSIGTNVVFLPSVTTMFVMQPYRYLVCYTKFPCNLVKLCKL